MVNRRTVMGAFILAAGAAAVVWVLVWVLVPSDESRIRTAMADLVSAVEKTGPESPVASARRAERAAGWFLADCEVRIDRAGVGAVASRTELRQAVFQIRSALDDLRITLHDEAITVSPDRGTATLRFTARAAATHRALPESAVQEVETRWRRTPDGWRIQSVATVEGIRSIR